jgi:hypothetical protein
MANATLDDQDEVLDLNGTPDKETDTEDRGDDFMPTEDDAPPAAKEPVEDKAGEEEPAPEREGRKNGSQMVPITRFNEVNERMKELASQNQQLIEALTRGQPITQEQAATPPSAAPTEQVQLSDIKALRQQYQEALLNGLDEKALDLQAQIDDMIEARATERAMERLNQSLKDQAQAREQQTFQQVVTEMEANYPGLDAKSDQANEDAILYVVAKRDALIQAGNNMTDALRKAVDQAAKVFALGQEQPAHIAQGSQQNRQQQSLMRNAAAANQQPPQNAGLGNRATAPQRMDVAKMSDAEFDAMPEAEKARLRGD